MGKNLSVIIGALAALVGLVLLLSWRYEFLFILRGILPCLLILAGIISLIAGISEMKDTSKDAEGGR